MVIRGKGFKAKSSIVLTNIEASGAVSFKLTLGILKRILKRRRLIVLKLLVEISKSDSIADTMPTAPENSRSGVFGGGRHGVGDAIALRDFNEQLQNNEATTLQNAFENAQGQFERDRAARLNVGQYNGRLGLEAFTANNQNRQYGADYGLRSFLTNEQNRQRGDELSQARTNSMLGVGKFFGDLGNQNQQMGLRSIDAMRSAGLQQQQLQQASLDLAKSDFDENRDYDMNMTQFLNSILRGYAGPTSSVQSTYSSNNPYSQLLGLGVGAAGLSNALKG